MMARHDGDSKRPREKKRTDSSSGEEKRSDASLRDRIEGIVPDIVKRAMISGMGAVFMTEETIRSAVTDLRLPKEAVGYLVQQADNTKEQFFSLIAREFREAFEKLDFTDEFAKLLSKFALEVKTEIRFVPADDGEGVLGSNLKPEIKSKTDVKKDK